MFLLQTEGVAIIFWIGKTNNVANFLCIVYAFIVTLKCFEYLKNEKKNGNENCQIKVYPLHLRLKSTYNGGRSFLQVENSSI